MVFAMQLKLVGSRAHVLHQQMRVVVAEIMEQNRDQAHDLECQIARLMHTSTHLPLK